MSEPILLDTPAPGVVRVTLNRPERLNALNHELVAALHDALAKIGDDREARVVVLTGAGRGFCAGLDLKGYGAVPGSEDADPPDRNLSVQKEIVALVTRLRALRQPVIAAVNGPAAGGGLALALASDVRVAARGARFATAFIKLGVSGCDIGVSWLLPRLVGAARAWELMLTGRVFPAEEAFDLGLLTRLVDPDDLLAAALDIAEQIVANDPFAVWMTKEVMWSNLETASLHAGIDLENRNQMLCIHAHRARGLSRSVGPGDGD
jgi:enoyl-CoA hydratase